MKSVTKFSSSLLQNTTVISIKEKIVEYAFTILLVLLSTLFSLFVGTSTTIPNAFLISGYGLLTVCFLGGGWLFLNKKEELFSQEKQLIQKEYELRRCQDTVPNDVETPFIESIYIFDTLSLTDKKFCYIHTRYFQNNMEEERYERYKYEVSSDADVPKLSDIYLEIEGIREEIDPILSKAKRTIECNESDLYETSSINSRWKKKSFFIYLHIPPQKTKKFTISYRSPALINLFEGKKDYIQISINRITERVSLNVKLTEDFVKKYRVKPAKQPDTHGGPCIFHIYDGSEERMKLTEKLLENKGEVPEISNDGVIWNILRPKIGYKYRFYFRIEEIKL